MCGILGYFGPQEHTEETVSKALNSFVHRGPDKQDFRSFDEGFLGHLRLSIIDLSESGDQPMSDAEGKHWIVFNGEIYNYRTLRNELSAKYDLRSTSDTEVLIYGYGEWGLKGLLERIRGMFAFVLFDRDRNKLVGARDHLGKKPFYYFAGTDGFGFCSAIEPLKYLSPQPFTVNDFAVHEFLIKSFISQPDTIYNEVAALMPGHGFEMNLDDKEPSVFRYWNPDFQTEEERSEEEWLSLVRDQIFQSVEKRLVADVPIAAFLSGGVDSSLVVSIARREFNYDLQTFTVRFPVAEYNEADVAARIASHLGTRHHELDFNLNLTDDIETIAGYFGQPFGDHSAIPTYYIARGAAEHVKVVLTGDGGDEGFAGYSMSLALKMAEKYRGVFGIGPLNKTLSSVPALRDNRYLSWLLELNSRSGGRYVFDPHGKKGFRRYTDRMHQTGDPDLGELRTWDSVQGDWVRKGQVVDLKHLLTNDFLVKTDVMTMAGSLEARSPLLDKDLIELAFRIPSKVKLKGNQSKYLLRQLVKDYLPDEISNLPKRGFSVPVDEWITANRQMVEDLLKNSMDFISQYVDEELVMNMLRGHGNGKNFGRQLWLLMMLAFWYKRNLR